MRDYLVIESPPGQDQAAWRRAEDRLIATGAWRKVAERRWFSVFLEGQRPPTYRHLPSTAGALIGEVFDTRAAHDGVGRELELVGLGSRPDEIADGLIARGFGRYVAVINDDRGPARILRDPLGAMEAIGWSRDGLRFVGSRLPDIPDLTPRDLAIDWRALSAILRQKNLASHICPLVGVTSYRPGVLSGPDGQGTVLWSPERFADRPGFAARPEDLRRLLDGVLAAWTQGRDGFFCELSGGLDSSIIAASLARGATKPRFAVNHAFPQAEADERRHAEAVADHIEVPLVVVERAGLRLTPEKLVGAAGGPRPNYVGGDPDHDADIARRLAEPGLDAVFTGRGGDAVLYQPAHPVLVRDVLSGRVDLPRARALEVLARRNVATTWTVLRKGLAQIDLTQGAGLWRFLTPEVASQPADLHPWLAAARRLTPARQLQLLGIVNGLSAFGESQRHRVGDIIDPWLSQPIVEMCLSIPAGRLAVGWRDRPFARAAFADRLPPAALARRGKGNLGAYFARSLGDSLAMLRPYLIEGRLVEAGLVSPERLDEALSVDQLIWSSLTAEIFILLANEAWARRWAERLAGLRGDPAYRAGAA